MTEKKILNYITENRNLFTDEEATHLLHEFEALGFFEEGEHLDVKYKLNWEYFDTGGEKYVQQMKEINAFMKEKGYELPVFRDPEVYHISREDWNYFARQKTSREYNEDEKWREKILSTEGKDASLTEFLHYFAGFGPQRALRIPEKVMAYIWENADYSRIPEFNPLKPLKKLELSKECLALIGVVTYCYLCDTEEQRKAFLEKWRQDASAEYIEYGEERRERVIDNFIKQNKEKFSKEDLGWLSDNFRFQCTLEGRPVVDRDYMLDWEVFEYIRSQNVDRMYKINAFMKEKGYEGPVFRDPEVFHTSREDWGYLFRPKTKSEYEEDEKWRAQVLSTEGKDFGMTEFLHYASKFSPKVLLRIPDAMLSHIRETADYSRIPDFNPHLDLKDVKISSSGHSIIGTVAYCFWCDTEEQRRSLRDVWRENEGEEFDEEKDQQTHENLMELAAAMEKQSSQGEGVYADRAVEFLKASGAMAPSGEAVVPGEVLPGGLIDILTSIKASDLRQTSLKIGEYWE